MMYTDKQIKLAYKNGLLEEVRNNMIEAEIAKKYLKKGSQLFIEGKIQTNSFTDKNGVKRYSTEIIAEQMQMLGYKYSTDDSNNAKVSNDTYDTETLSKPYIQQEEQPNYIAENFDYKAVSTTIDTEIPF